jgi:hypothetical protein
LLHCVLRQTVRQGIHLGGQPLSAPINSPLDATGADVAGATGVTYTIQLNCQAIVAKNRSRT